MTDNINPAHYKNGDIECIEAIRAALTPEEFRGYCKGNAIKYVWREGMKGGNESLQKANWYMDKAVSVSSQPQPATPARAEELQADDGWIDRESAETPARSSQSVEVRLRCGMENRGRAGSFSWGINDADTDIVAYRLAKEQA